MKIMITGSPGTGKTSLAKEIAKIFNLKVINEKDFALKNSLGFFNDDNELEIPLKEFEKKANLFLSKNDNVVFEGHVLCEMKLKVDKIILLTINPDDLEARLEQRPYSTEKIMDNVFCEGIEYCKKHLLKNYVSKDIIFVKSSGSLKSTLALALSQINN